MENNEGNNPRGLPVENDDCSIRMKQVAPKLKKKIKIRAIYLLSTLNAYNKLTVASMKTVSRIRIRMIGRAFLLAHFMNSNAASAKMIYRFKHKCKNSLN